MFGDFQNSVQIEFNLAPDGPILVRSQMAGIEPGIADVEFQRTHRQGQDTVFLAGSGLKGVIRAHCERLLRSNDVFACDPTLVRNYSACGHFKRRPDPQVGPKNTGDYPHAGQCPTCFIFGSLHLAGRFRFSDAYPTEDTFEEANRTEVRTGVGINRKEQAAATGVLYDTEIVVGGRFTVRMSGENFSLWQLGLIGQALQDLDSGFIQVGGCKSRGMGAVKLNDWRVSFRFLDRRSGCLTGAVQKGSGRWDYSLEREDVLPIEESPESLEDNKGIFRVVNYRNSAVVRLFDRLSSDSLGAYLARRR